jgi:uncharacterized membrane protein YeaQ/YmgE (transglycosylase-associated protein family)
VPTTDLIHGSMPGIVTTATPLLVKCGHSWSLGGILFLLIGGVVIGILGKPVAPGDRDKIPFWLTVICGIVGIFIGNWLYVDILGGRCATSGIDWLRHIVQVLAAAIIVMVAASLTGRSRRRV